MREITFVDTTLRDGQLSLWATGMRTEWMLPVAWCFGHAGFTAVEIQSPTWPKKLIRELREDPWERIRLVAAEVGDVPLRSTAGRSLAGFQLTPPAVTELYIERMAANGIRQARVSDPSNTVANQAVRVRALRAVGIEPILNLIYSLAPRYTDAYYADKARQTAALRPMALCIKDPGGLLTPERTRTLVPAVLAAAGDVPVEFHTHCNTGLGPRCCLVAVEHGISILNAAVPPLAQGTSNPSSPQLARNLRAQGHTVRLDAGVLEPVTEHFTCVAAREGLPVGRPAEYDVSYYHHQVPGGMMSNLRHQLTRLGVGERLPEVLEEIARVRSEFGDPIMVTPYSQFVGTQATLNVVTGERYAEVSDEVILYALGAWGQVESDAIQPDVRDRILARPRGRELATWRPPQPTREDLRRELGGPGVSDDELAVRCLIGPYDPGALRHFGARPDGGWSSETPIVTLVREIARRPHVRSVSLAWGGSSLSLRADADGGRGGGAGLPA